MKLCDTLGIIAKESKSSRDTVNKVNKILEKAPDKIKQECPCETLKELAEKLQINYDTIKAHWIPASKKLSPKIRGIFGSSDVATFTNAHVHQLLKYPHSTQDKLAQTSIDKSLVS